MTYRSEGDIHTNGINIHYHRSGTPDKPPLFLLHGITDSGAVWRRVARDLASDYDLVMPDARGHGQSDDASNGFSLTLLADDVAGVMKALGLQKSYVWGHSMGAITAAIVAAQYPEQVRAVVLEDPPLFEVTPVKPPVTPPASAAPDFRSMSVEERLATARAMNPTWHPDELPPWAESKAQVDPTVTQHLWSVRSHPWREVLAQIECPTLLLTGSPTAGAIVTPEVAAEAHRLLKRGQVLQLEGSGHNIHRESYEQTLHVVRTFLHTHDS